MAKVMVAMYCFEYPDDYNEYDEDTWFVSNDKFLKASLLCDKFRVLDLDTLIIDDYSFRDVVELRDEIVNLHLGEVSEESLDNGYERFNLVGCTQNFIDSEFGYDKNGNLAFPNDCNYIPIAYKGEIGEAERVMRIDCCGEPISLFVDVVDKKVEVYISECIVSNEKLESEDYYLVIGTLTFSYFKNLFTKVSNDIWEFGDTACVLLNHKNGSNNIIVQSKYKKVCLDLNRMGEGAFEVVIPPSVDIVSLDRALDVVGVEYYLSNGKLTLYFPKVGKAKKVISALYKSLLKDKLNINAFTSGFMDVNSLIKKMKDEYNIDIKFY